MSKKQINIKGAVGVLAGHWRKSGKTISGARHIWLFCNKLNLNVPNDVMEVFTKWVQKTHEDHKEKHPNRSRRIAWGHIVLWRYVNILQVKGFSQVDALERYCTIIKKKNGDIIHTETARRRYNLAKDHMEQVHRSWQ